MEHSKERQKENQLSDYEKKLNQKTLERLSKGVVDPDGDELKLPGLKKS